MVKEFFFFQKQDIFVIVMHQTNILHEEMLDFIFFNNWRFKKE